MFWSNLCFCERRKRNSVEDPPKRHGRGGFRRGKGRREGERFQKERVHGYAGERKMGKFENIIAARSVKRSPASVMFTRRDGKIVAG